MKQTSSKPTRRVPLADTLPKALTVPRSIRIGVREAARYLGEDKTRDLIAGILNAVELHGTWHTRALIVGILKVVKVHGIRYTRDYLNNSLENLTDS